MIVNSGVKSTPTIGRLKTPNMLLSEVYPITPGSSRLWVPETGGGTILFTDSGGVDHELGNTSTSNLSQILTAGGDATGLNIQNLGMLNFDTAGPKGISIGVDAGSASTNDGDQIAIGKNATTDGPESIAIGVDTSTVFDRSIAIGSNSDNVGFGDISIGRNCYATGFSSTAIGYASSAIGTGGISIGLNADITATGVNDFNIAIGTDSVVSGLNTESSIAIGRLAEANAKNCIAIGHDANAYGDNSIAIGEQAYTTQNYGTAIGYRSYVRSSEATAVGYKCYVYTGSNGSTAIGYQALCTSAEGSVAISSSVSGDRCISILGNCSANYAISIGYGAFAQATGAIAIGGSALAGATASGANSIALGANSSATANQFTVNTTGLAAAAVGVNTPSVFSSKFANKTAPVALVEGGGTALPLTPKYWMSVTIGTEELMIPLFTGTF